MSKYRALRAKANYLGVDRPDIQFAVKKACRGIAARNEADVKLFKRIARHIQAFPKVVVARRGSGPSGRLSFALLWIRIGRVVAAGGVVDFYP